MKKFILDKTLCSKDGICKRVCPVNIIRLDKEGWPHFVDGGGEHCISCGQCIAYCPHTACSLEHMPITEVSKIDRSKLPTPEQMTALAKSRRSLRMFSKTPVESETILTIMDTVRFAPTAKNKQEIRWIIVNSAEQLKILGNHMADCMELQTSEDPEMKMLSSAWRKGLDPFFRGAQQLAIAVGDKSWPFSREDGAIALSYFELVSHSYGIGCCWGGYFTSFARAYPPLWEALNIKDSEMVAGAQMFGYPSIKSTNIPPRNKLNLSWL